MTLAVLSREGKDDLLVLLHGLGCVKESFAALWDAPDLAGCGLYAPDLPGHGASHNLAPETWTMQGMAACVSEALNRAATGYDRIHLVAHSMGGAVGLLLAEQSGLPLASFINVEGNLVAEDCGLLSRRTAEMDLAMFVGGKFETLKERARGSDDPVVRKWAGWMDTCAADAFHATSRSLVEWSDCGRLLGIYLGLAAPTTYIFGEHSANPDVLAHLENAQTRMIAGCGHFPMIEMPGKFTALIRQAIASS